MQLKSSSYILYFNLAISCCFTSFSRQHLPAVCKSRLGGCCGWSPQEAT